MNKIIFNSVFVIVLLMFINVVNPAKSEADWWDRPDVKPSQPSTPRDVVLLPTQSQPTSVPPTTAVPTNNPTSIPTSAPTNQPTTTPVQPTSTPKIGGGPTAIPTQSSNNTGSTSSSEDPCAAGKSYIGPYCGWSPSVGGNSSGGSTSSMSPRIGGEPQVLGLSNTSSSEIAWSDIIMLAGVLCLVLYTRSKFVTESRSY